MPEHPCLRILLAMRTLMRWVSALFALEGTWTLACELLRERAPLALVAFGALPWLLLVSAWRVRLPRGARTTIVLALALCAIDMALDLWVPYQPRYALPAWQLARSAALAVGATLAERPVMRTPAASVWGSVARAGSLGLVALVIFAMAFIALVGRRDRTQRAEAALVLGFALDDRGRARPSLVARVEQGARLYRAGWVRTLVLSGGAPRAGVTEARAMRALALARGVPDEALVLEERSRSTEENITLSAPLLRRAGVRRVLIVSEPFHLPRAMLLARRARIDALPSPAPSPAWRDPRAASYWLFRDAPLYLFEALRSLAPDEPRTLNGPSADEHHRRRASFCAPVLQEP